MGHIYETDKKNRQRLIREVRQGGMPIDVLDEPEPIDAYLWCSPKQSVASAVIQFAEAMDEPRPRLWLCTFAASLVALEEIAERTRPQRVVLDRIQLSRSPHCVEFVRKKMKGRVAKVHAKAAVLRTKTQCVVLVGSANLSQNAGAEMLHVSTDPGLAEWVCEQIESLEEGSLKRRRLA